MKEGSTPLLVEEGTRGSGRDNTPDAGTRDNTPDARANELNGAAHECGAPKAAHQDIAS